MEDWLHYFTLNKSASSCFSNPTVWRSMIKNKVSKRDLKVNSDKK